MKSLNLTLIASLFLLTGLSFGQDIDQEKCEKPYIEVTGTAEKEVIPDEIFISITLRERKDGKETLTVDKQESDLKKALKGLNIPLEDLYLSDANADFIPVRWNKKEVIAKTEYMLKVTDAATVGKVFEKLDELKIEDAFIAKVSHSKIEQLRKEIRISAIKAAKEKADYLLAAIGVETGKPLKVLENMIPQYAVANTMARRANKVVETAYFDDEAAGDQIQFQKIKLQASIYVKFEIK